MNFTEINKFLTVVKEEVGFFSLIRLSEPILIQNSGKRKSQPLLPFFDALKKVLIFTSALFPALIILLFRLKNSKIY